MESAKAGSTVHASHLQCCCQLLGRAQALQDPLELLFICGIPSWLIQEVRYLWQGGGTGWSLRITAGHLHLH